MEKNTDFVEIEKGEQNMRKAWTKWIVLLVVLLLILAAAAGLLFTFDRFVIVEGHLYKRNEPALDLREREVTTTAYEKLKEKLPGCTILWNVPFQGTTYQSFTEELTVTQLSMEDVEQLDYFPQLQVVQAQDCRDYAALMALKERRPNCRVNYRVEIGGVMYGCNATSLTLTSLTREDMEKLSYLTKLQRIDASGCTEYGLLMELREQHPEWDISFRIMVGNTECTPDMTEILADNATVDQLRSAMAIMPELQSVVLVNPRASASELQQLRGEYPNVQIQWSLVLGEKTIPEDAEEVDISGVQVESVEQAKAYASLFPNIKKLIMSDCGLDNETMAAFREEMRDQYKVVWTVYLGSICKLRTDAVKFMPLTQGDGYFRDWNAVDLKYCEDLEAIDIGHSRVRKIDWVAYMPHLKYLILADTDVRRLDGIENCKELVWLELQWCAIESYEPLLGCTALEDLNVSRTFADPAPISQMTWLKNLWCMERGGGVVYQWSQDLPDTHVVSAGTDSIGYGWRKLPNYYKMRDALGMYYMK